MRNAFLIAALALASNLAAATPADSCEDLSFRLYRADLYPGGVKFEDIESDEFGDHQMVELTLKNVGSVKVGSAGSGSSFNVAPIRVKIGGYVADGYVDLPVAVNGFTKVWLRLPPGALEHCEVLDVKIDLKQTAKQKGCDCFDNDLRQMRVVLAGGPSCRYL